MIDIFVFSKGKLIYILGGGEMELVFWIYIFDIVMVWDIGKIV